MTVKFCRQTILDELMDHAIEEQIRKLLASGNKIGAIKLYREETGTGLAEAKSAVEAIEAGHSLSSPVREEKPPLHDSDAIQEIVGLLQRGQKIQAIKLIRTKLGCDLKSAKKVAEKIGEQHGIAPSSGVGCLGILFVGISFLFCR